MQPADPGVSADLLFIGGLFPKEDEQSIFTRSRGTIQFAANALQWHLIGGLDHAMGAPITVLNAVFVGSYPKLYRDLWVRGRRWSHAQGANDESVGFLNLFGVKHAWRTLALISRARSWALAGKARSKRCIVVYSMHTPFIMAAALAKRADPSIRVCLIVPDLPEHMNLSEGLPLHVSILKVVDRRIMNCFMHQIDCFALLTRYMAEPLSVGARPWIVMEGAVNPDEAPVASSRSGTDGAEKVILYTGTLVKAYGILQLLQAFETLSDPSYRLWICGAGEAEQEVKEAASRDGRIRFFGQVDRNRALALQREATVLVNPRGDTAEFTKYSFPSKIMEYLLSGTPAVVRRLPGMPEEYTEHLFVVDGASPTDLARKLAEVCEMPPADRRQFAERARRFVIEKKNARAQAGRILALITPPR